MKRKSGPVGPQAAGAAALACVALVLAGCGGGRQDDGGPVSWWHNLEGGPIADRRPAAPGATAAYPHLSSVPPKPKPIDPASRATTYAALAVDRANATYEAHQDPLTNAPPRDQNGLFAPAKPLPAASPDAAGAALEATAPPARAPTKPTPTKPDPAIPAGKVAPATGTDPAAEPVSAVDTPIPDIVQDTGPMPTVPDAPPAQPVLSGVSLPVTVPRLPPRAPPTAATIAALTAADTAPLSVSFSPGSAVLPFNQQGPLRTLANRRGVHVIEIIGFGEAEGQDSQSQLAGVRLGLLRAQAIASALAVDGVPMAALRIAADAPGRGGAARLIE